MVKAKLRNIISSHYSGIDFDILMPPDDKMGDYSTNLAFALAKKEGKNPIKAGEELTAELSKDKELSDIFEKIEAVKPGFVNFYFKDDFLRKQLKEISGNKNYGFNDSMKGKTVMVEYTDPNPFKLFHIGHLMSNAIGESIARLYEASGAKVLRVNYQGDVGLHVAKAVWGMINERQETCLPNRQARDKRQGWDVERIGQAYAKGAKAYEEDEQSKKEIEGINNKIYDRSDGKINKIYDLGKKLSLEYFEAIYKNLGTRFDHYFFESEVGADGVDIVKKHPDIFVESDGAVIFKGENYGLHTRVFISSKGLPTYEAKELGLNKKKFELYSPDLSVIVTGNEIFGYFKVLLKAMELVMPDVAAKTRHVPHGMLRFATGKMSSRTGDVITADSLIEQTKSRLPESENEEVNPPCATAEAKGDTRSLESYGEAREKIAIGAIKYSILKQSPGHDIIFDFEKSLSVKGDSAPYLQYTYARLSSILKKSGQTNLQFTINNLQLLNHELELKLVRQLIRFPDVVMESGEEIAPQKLALYLYELANCANQFYEAVRVLDDENYERHNARLMLVETVAAVLERGLSVLGISVLKRI